MPTQTEDELKDQDIDSSPSDEETLDDDLSLEEGGDDDSSAHSKKSAEARIGELVATSKTALEEARQAREEARLARDETERLKTAQRTPTPPAMTPEVQKAVDALKNLGFTRTEDVKAEIQAIEDRMALNNEHARLENGFDGADGRPKYSRAEVEEYMRTSGVYNPEAAYKLMHETELLDWSLKRTESTTKKRAFTEKPGSPGSNRDDQTITRDKIADAMKTPAGRQWYEDNREKILDLVSKGQL